MNIYAAAAVLAALIAAAHTTVRVMAGGQSASIPVLGIIAVAVGLAALAGVLAVLRLLIRDGLRLRPVPA